MTDSCSKTLYPRRSDSDCIEEVQDKIGKVGTPGSRSYGEGMHEAMDDIVKAMKELASYLA
jgi:hypothetical protein